ncbi:MAG: hypothetical protein ACLUHE_08455 [Christensenellales bacterium]
MIVSAVRLSVRPGAEHPADKRRRGGTARFALEGADAFSPNKRLKGQTLFSEYIGRRYAHPDRRAARQRASDVTAMAPRDGRARQS